VSKSPLDWPSQKVTWADLMFTESEIIIGTMLELMHSYGIPCFSVHDSIIARKSDQQIAMEILKDQFFSLANIEPRLKVSWRPTQQSTPNFDSRQGASEQ